jgi:hypothetical protein
LDCLWALLGFLLAADVPAAAEGAFVGVELGFAVAAKRGGGFGGGFVRLADFAIARSFFAGKEGDGEFFVVGGGILCLVNKS